MASWDGVTSSSDGRRLAAVINPGAIYASTNSGITWTATSAPIAWWKCIAASTDGMKLIAGETCIGLGCFDGAASYTSADGGVTWAISISENLSVASSADGNILAAAGGAIFVSTNGGGTWSGSGAPGSDLGWRAIAASWDGNKLVAGSAHGAVNGIYTSTDSGATWTKTSAPAYWWLSVASSADGTALVAGSRNNGCIYTSVDSGATWISNSAPAGVEWKAVASSADGKKLFAAVNGGGIYTYQIPPALTIASSNNDIIVSWPSSATGFALQQNSRLDSTNWVTPTNAPVSDGIKKQVIIPQNVGPMFFRLIIL